MKTKVISARTGKTVFEIEYDTDNASIMRGTDKAVEYVKTHYPKNIRVVISIIDPKDNFSGTILTVG